MGASLPVEASAGVKPTLAAKNSPERPMASRVIPLLCACEGAFSVKDKLILKPFFPVLFFIIFWTIARFLSQDQVANGLDMGIRLFREWPIKKWVAF